MISFETDLSAPSTRAGLQAKANFEQNHAALRASQPSVDLASLVNIGEWVFGRDGSLTARDVENRWISGSSLPHRVASELMRRLEINGVVAALLAPSHAAQIRVALDRLSAQQAILVIQPSAATLAFHLHCDDFSRSITSHRLFFITGEEWIEQLRRFYLEHRGLPTPCQFIRLPIVDSVIVEPIIAGAQEVFAQITRVRQQRSAEARSNRSPNAGKRSVGVIAPSHFRLWNDKGHALLSALKPLGDEIQIVHVDPDDPLQAAPSDLPSRFRSCDAIVSADVCRADLPNLLPAELPWITWLTSPRVVNAGKNDRLIEACWPVISRDAGAPKSLAIMCDTARLDTPRDLEDFSSHRLLWETLREELQNNPFQLSCDPHLWLRQTITRLKLQPDAFPLVRFVQQLVMPAYAQGIARALHRASLPLTLLGAGWDQIEELTSSWAGPIQTREQFHAALAQPIALVHVWPWMRNHPIESAGCHLVHIAGNGRERFLRDANAALSAPSSPPATKPPALSPSLLRDILSAIPA